MSRLSRFLRSALCWWMGGHLPSPVRAPAYGPSSTVVSECLRCHVPLVHWSPSPRDLLASPSGVLWWEAAAPPTPAQFEAWRRGWGQVTAAPTSPSQKAPDTESASAPNGAGR